MQRKDIIFCKMLKCNCVTLGKFEAPVLINENILRHGLEYGTPDIMKTVNQWLHSNESNRMVMFTNKFGDSWAVMNTNRVSLDQKRSIDWVRGISSPLPWLQDSLNPVWITAYHQ